jgi:hypothetical protein
MSEKEKESKEINKIGGHANDDSEEKDPIEEQMERGDKEKR